MTLPSLGVRTVLFLAVGVGLTVPARALTAIDDPSFRPADRISVSMHAALVRRHQPGTWSVVSVNAFNPTAQEGEALLSTHFAEEPNRQFARRIWLPPGAQRASWLPVRLPSSSGERRELAALKGLNLSNVAPGAGGREVLERRDDELLTSELLLSLDHSSFLTGLLLNRPLRDETAMPIAQDDDVLDLAIVTRLTGNLPRTTLSLQLHSLPPWPEGLEGYDQLLLAGDRLRDDSAGLAALRGWVRRGGRLWIMLDRTSPELVTALLGQACPFEVVDEVELDRFELESLDPANGRRVSELCEYEQPVKLVRVLADGADVRSRVDNWPVEIWVPYGEGEVLITTLAPRGFHDEKNAESPRTILRGIASYLFDRRKTPVDPGILKPALEEQIGYRIPSRSLGASILGGYCLLLLVLGVALSRVGRLDWFALTVPLLTTLAAGILLAAGVRNTGSVEPTVVLGQMLDVSRESNEIHYDGLAAIYDQVTREVPLRADGRDWLLPEAADDQLVRRWIVEGDTSYTQNAMAQAGSVRFAKLRGTRPLAKPVRAAGHFDERGLVGRFALGDLEGVEEPVLVNPLGTAMSVTLGPNGAYEARSDQVLPVGQLSDQALLSDAQRRRQDILRTLLNPDDDRAFPATPTFFAWCGPLAENLHFPADYRLSGLSLLMVPLQLERTPADSAFQIPSAFLRPDVIPGSLGISKAYNPRTGRWVRRLIEASDTNLRFRLPREVLPCELRSGTLTMRLNAPSREVRLVAWVGQERKVVRTIRNPNGVYDIPLSADELQLDETDGVRLSLIVGESARKLAQPGRPGSAASPGPAAPGIGDGESGGPVVRVPESPSEAAFDDSTWEVDYLRLTLAGHTLPEGERDR